MSSNLLLVINKPEVLDAITLRSYRCIDNIYKATSGEEALRVLEKNKIDIIITAYELDIIYGDVLLLKAKNMHPDIGRILITCYKDENLERICEKYNITHNVIECPLTTEGLTNIINSFCDRKESLN